MSTVSTITIRLNGAPAETPEGATVSDLLLSLGRSGPGIAVAVNERVVRREDHVSTVLRPGDRVDVIQAVGGG